MANIDPSTQIDPSAVLDDGVSIGPFCRVGANVHLEKGVRLISHAVVEGHTRIGRDSCIFPFATIGSIPQDMKYQGEESRLVIGSNNTIREYVTINPGTKKGTMMTKTGAHCLFMVGSHIAHDCQLGDHVILVNNATLGGHVHIGDHAIIGGLSAIHQFVRIGQHVMIGGMSGVAHDVIPYACATGNRACLSGINIVGMKRRQFPRDTINHLRRAYRLLFAQEGTMAERMSDVAGMFKTCPQVQEILDFISAAGGRGLCQPKNGETPELP